ncbi:unnamed protein product [Malus baccata var. baccata]
MIKPSRFGRLNLGAALLLCSEKRVSAVAISSDGSYVCFADKFGVLWVVDVDLSDGNQAFVDKKAAPLLSYYCSIITSLEFSPDGRFFVSADRDFKIRCFPRSLLMELTRYKVSPLVIQSLFHALPLFALRNAPRGFLFLEVVIRQFVYRIFPQDLS